MSKTDDCSGIDAFEFYKLFLQMLGSAGGPYDIDKVNYLSAAMECSAYARAHMLKAKRFRDRAELMHFAIGSMAFTDLVLEFGVFQAESLNRIARTLPTATIHGFDSFEGLPEDWTNNAIKGHFAQQAIPQVEKNVNLVVGWYEDTLPAFAKEHKGRQISLLHVDCDLYSSTQTIFSILRQSIVSGTIIVFDEYWNYPEWRAHEFRAFSQYVEQSNIDYEYIGLVPNYEQVAVRILRVG